MTAPQDLKSTYPPNNAVRVGTLTRNSEGVLGVSFQGEFVPVGYLDTSGLLAENEPVAAIRGEATWLALGRVATAPSVPRIATAVETSNSGAFTGLTQVMGVSCPILYANVTYKIEAYVHYAGTNVGDIITTRIREDSIAGTDLQLDPNRSVVATTGTTSHIYVEYTPTADVTNKVFVLGAARGGAGTINLLASATQPSYMYVDYVRGAV